MGKTFRKPIPKYDDEKQGGRKGKHHLHSNNHKSGGMKLIVDLNDDFFDDEVEISDHVSLELNSEDPT